MARSGVAHLVALATVVLVMLLLIGVGSQPVLASEDDAGARVTETTEAGASAGGSPSGTAGLSLLVAAVAATLWNVALGERRSRQRASARTE